MRFCFYSEYKDLKGGYTTLILTLIRGLYHEGQNVILINYKDGLIANELKSSGVDITIIEIETLNKKNAASFIRNTDTLIIPRFYENLTTLFEINPKVIYYDINDYICKISDYKYGIKLPFLGKRLVKKLLANQALIFMDDTGPGNLQREFGINVNTPRFLPVAIEDEKVNTYLNSNKKIGETINLTYIGRAVDWKMYPLKKIVDDCKDIVNTKIHFHIIVDKISSFRHYIDTNTSGTPNISFEVYENLPPSAIKPFLESHTDIYFGMGTTAIQAASIGIPTVLLDFSTKPFPNNYSYRWFSETEHYSLGKNIEVVPFPKGNSLTEILELVRNKQSREMISKNAFQYVTEHHSVSIVVRDLITYSKQCAFRIRDSKNLIPYYSNIHRIIKTIAPSSNSKTIQYNEA